MANEGGAVAAQQQQQQPPARTSWWQILKSIAFQMVLFYMITSFFRGNKPNQTGSDGKPTVYAANVFREGEEMELYVFMSEYEEFSLDAAVEVWRESLVFGSWEDGVNGDGSRETSMEVAVPDEVQYNGSWFIHVLLAKNGYTLDPEDEYYDSESIVHQYKMFNRYRRRRVHSTSNLLTGEADVAPDAIRSTEQASDAPVEIMSYFHPNLTVNVVYDNTMFTEGSVPPPMDKYIEFNSTGDGYFPILYINDYWNLAQEYAPLNDTVKSITLYLTYTPLSFFRFQLYASVTRDNPWGQMLGQPDASDEEQDTVKQTLMETSPYLLTLTVIVSIVHSVFEFLAFKNDVQFWRSRKSLEGLSVRSVFFNVFQSLIVLLYILDNETNTMVIIMVFVGLLIDLWKVTKVVEIKIDRENLIAGFVPRLTFVDRPSYVQTSTKEYDKMAFKYLGCVLFPLFIGYGIYSLLYQEHKGWYSFLLSMCYGFLLTFGFITMTPQLFINYKLKSVAHLPWRMLTYKALNTFIDDMFAFVIKMPTMYRIGCFRDDIVFFIYLYQRWIYRIDPKRVNEFGTTGEDTQHHAVSSPDAENSSEANPEVKSETDKKND